MPIYEFECQKCGVRFEELGAAGAKAPCPQCKSSDVERRQENFAADREKRRNR